MSSHRGKSAGKGKGKFYNKGQARKGPIKKADSQHRESTTGSVSSRYKFHPMGDSSTSTPRHTFTTVLEHLADQLEKIIVKHSKDVVSSILSMTPLNLALEEPDHDEYISLRPEEHLRVAEQRILDKRYDDDHHRWVKRKDIYEDNTSKVFGTVKDEWCTTAMLNKLAQHPDWYEDILVRRDPFELLRLIKKYMYEADSSVYVQYNKEMNMRRFMGITQHDDEDIHEFTLRFKQY